MADQRPITGDQIRAAFLRFFEERGHLVVPSASLIPAGDPTLLLTSAGMVPFKPYYAGDEQPPNRRLASAQKSFRTTDIDEVGDLTHLTFFEMLGNFSIGDYFKREAIAWAWEFVTDVLGLDPVRLFVTVHEGDDEAEAIWRDEIGVDPGRISRCGDADNFWGPAGAEGACGPSSEIYYELHPGRNGTPCDDPEGRFVEIWNLVFPQFHQAPDGTRTDLPAPGIDTGLGLERVAAIMQGVVSLYETDLFRPIIERVEEISGKRYGSGEETDAALRVVAEHARAAVFLIADGVVPANEGRGYVLRRVIRRGIRFARKLGVEGAFLARVAEAVEDRMGAAYPELIENRRFVHRTL
ncbi:MAG: alanine--tRNA ligase, partial [Chloroflexi bacterium]|nr:alanine--tRNA ligase [Chloroflexota bacterium]